MQLSVKSCVVVQELVSSTMNDVIGWITHHSPIDISQNQTLVSCLRKFHHPQISQVTLHSMHQPILDL